MARAPAWRARCAAAALAVVLAAVGPAPAAAHGAGGVEYQGDEAIYSVAWNAAGTMFAAATSAGNISLFDGSGHVLLKTWHAVNGPINEVAFSPDGSKIAAASGAYRVDTVERNVKVFDIATTATLLTLSPHRDWVTSLAWSPDGRWLASASGVDDHENLSRAYGEVLFWDTTTGVLLWNASPLPSYPARIAWSPDGQYVATMGHLNDVWLLHYDRNRPTKEMINDSFHDPPPMHASHGWSIAWSPDSRYLAGGFSRDLDLDGATDVGPVIILDTTLIGSDGRAAHIRAAAIHTKPTEWLSWDSSGMFIASCSGIDRFDAQGQPGTDGIVDSGDVIIYNFTKPSDLLAGVNEYIGGSSFCSSVAWRPGSLSLVAGNADGSLRVYYLDADGDGCFVWEDAAPDDPTRCAAPPEPATPFETWALPALAGAVAFAVIALAVLARRSRLPTSSSNGERRPAKRGKGAGAPPPAARSKRKPRHGP